MLSDLTKCPQNYNHLTDIVIDGKLFNSKIFLVTLFQKLNLSLYQN